MIFQFIMNKFPLLRERRACSCQLFFTICVLNNRCNIWKWIQFHDSREIYHEWIWFPVIFGYVTITFSIDNQNLSAMYDGMV